MICQGHRKIDNNSARRLAESARRLAEYVLDNGRGDLGAAASRRGETISNRHRYSGKEREGEREGVFEKASSRRRTRPRKRKRKMCDIACVPAHSKDPLGVQAKKVAINGSLTPRFVGKRADG